MISNKTGNNCSFVQRYIYVTSRQNRPETAKKYLYRFLGNQSEADNIQDETVEEVFEPFEKDVTLEELAETIANAKHVISKFSPDFLQDFHLYLKYGQDSPK